MVSYTCNTSCWKAETRGSQIAQPGQRSGTLSQNLQNEKTGDIAQHCLSSIHSTAKQEEKN